MLQKADQYERKPGWPSGSAGKRWARTDPLYVDAMHRGKRQRIEKAEAVIETSLCQAAAVHMAQEGRKAVLGKDEKNLLKSQRAVSGKRFREAVAELKRELSVGAPLPDRRVYGKVAYNVSQLDGLSLRASKSVVSLPWRADPVHVALSSVQQHRYLRCMEEQAIVCRELQDFVMFYECCISHYEAEKDALISQSSSLSALGLLELLGVAKQLLPDCIVDMLLRAQQPAVMRALRANFAGRVAIIARRLQFYEQQKSEGEKLLAVLSSTEPVAEPVPSARVCRCVGHCECACVAEPALCDSDESDAVGSV